MAIIYDSIGIIGIYKYFCSLYSLPTEISNLEKLTSINLHDNGLTMLPDEFAKLVNLRRFDVSNNQLRYLTPGYVIFLLRSFAVKFLYVLYISVCMWELLEELNISNNFLEDVPLSLACLPNLQSIAAKNNPFRTYPSTTS